MNSRTRHAIKIIMDGHKTIRGLFRQYEALHERTPEFRAKVVEELFMALGAHAFVAEKALAPELLAATGGRPLDPDEFGVAGRNDVLKQIARLRELGPEHENFEEGMTELIADAEVQLRQEELRLLPYLMDLSVDEVERLASRITELKSAYESQPRFAGARPEVAQNPGGGEQKRKTAA